MKPIKNYQDLSVRLNRLESQFAMRNKMVMLCDEMYLLKRERKSGYMGSKAAEWRAKVPAEYWETSTKPQNVIDIMTAVLSGHPPQYHCSIPGGVNETLPSRAEMFLAGVWWLNSLRQQVDIYREVVFKTVKDGACGIRVYWIPNLADEGEPATLSSPEDAEQIVPARLYDQDSLPICVEPIDINNLYWSGKGRGSKPFSEIFYCQQRYAGDVIDEWEGQEGVDLSKIIKNTKPDEMYTIEEKYVEWWGQDALGQVWYAIAFREEFIIKPTKVNYPAIPFVLTSYKKVSSAEPSHQNLPFLHPIMGAVDKQEYLKSRTYRLIDMYANMNPYHAGEQPLAQMDATWGKVIELGPKEEIRLPQWTGQPPDVYREIEQNENTIAEGSFSSTMFGEVSSRVSGYALSQVVGADTLRTDTPRGNLELALSAVSSLIFKLMRVFSPGIYMSITAQVQSRKLAAMVEGEETRSMIVSTFIKPKQTSDEVRLASLGAQMASMPNSPVSMRYILEKFFGVAQPEEEMARKLDELAMKNPIVTLMALIEALKDSGSPYTAIVEQELQKAIGEQAGVPPAGPGNLPPGGGPLGQDQQEGGLGAGLAQALLGNPPQIPPSGNPGEENPSMLDMMMGGPTEA